MLLLFFLVWIIFNGNITLEITIFGVAIAALMFTFVCKFMDYSIQKEKKIYKKMLMFIAYAFLLVTEIIKANMGVIHLILSRTEITEPVIVRFRTTLKTDMARTILANSITLTPGTITVALKGDELVVHCLDKTFAEGMEDSQFVRMLEKMEE